jgi:hypothetical protein
MYISNSCSLEHNCALSTVELYGLDTPLWFIQKLYSALYLNIQGIHTHTDEGLSVDIPKPDPADSFYQAASDSDDMSMRVVSVSERRSDRHYELEYMELRSGRKIYKM